MIKHLILETQGYSDDDKLTVNPGICRCGNIKDGVGFVHDDGGGWVLSFTDLQRIYIAALRTRKVKKPSAGGQP